ncbi:hypothetical protein PPACK8108_LOCUS24471 [Phakopsora pachyrhizi]|uniref:t-SNARE coiled-coil homology domain-containing protein n=1 Tax=Phakopsora pachyrhizi TaxID=170000 RepID=A0AAV0BPV1_PHAPC|nr:hypothetical protein PPACK8108_LOCUS24471 [Phakopsora pachyrhizi]
MSNQCRTRPPSKENINLMRLINRLEQISNLNLARPVLSEAKQDSQFSSSDISGERTSKDRSAEDIAWYWELKGLETTVKHAKTILKTIEGSSSISQFQENAFPNYGELNDKLKVIESRVKAALELCKVPASKNIPRTKKKVVNSIKKPELPVSLELKPDSRVLNEANKANDLEKGLNEASLDQARKPLIIDEQSITNIELIDKTLNQNSSIQDQLTDELSQMASQLKKNVHHFNKLLVEDQAIIQSNQTKLENNSTLMKTQGGKLSEISIRGRKTTWLTILAVLAVVLAWIMMFIIIRLT